MNVKLVSLLCGKEKDNSIKQAIEEAVQLERDRTKQTVSDERVSNWQHRYCVLFAVLPFLPCAYVLCNDDIRALP